MPKTTTKPPDRTNYTTLPTTSEPTPNPTHIILHHYHPNQTLYVRRTIILTLSILTLTLLTYLLYPSNPTLHLTTLKLNHIHFHPSSHPPSLDLSLSLTLSVRNRDLVSLSYSSLTVAVAYRGRELGFVRSNGGVVKAKDVSVVNATLDLDGFEVLHDLISFIRDFSEGFIPFETVSVVNGFVGVFFVHIPIKAKVACEVDVNPITHKIAHQNCYPELNEAAASPSPY